MRNKILDPATRLIGTGETQRCEKFFERTLQFDALVGSSCCLHTLRGSDHTRGQDGLVEFRFRRRSPLADPWVALRVKCAGEYVADRRGLCRVIPDLRPGESLAAQRL